MSTTLDSIAPGSKILVKVVKRPTNAAAAKTIARLLGKDKVVRAEDARQRAIRKTHFRQSRRGGRFWDIHVVKQPAVTGAAGESGTITATLDVLKDLRSVVRFVDISAA